MEWTCACGMSNASEAKFCNQCGAPGPVPQVPPPAEPTPPPPPPAPPGGSGPAPPPPAALRAPSPTQAAAEPKKKGGCAKWIILALIILLVFCLIGGGVVGVLYWKGKGALKKGFLKGAAVVTDVAKQQAAIAEMKSIAAALEAYKNDKGVYPSPGHNPDSYYSLVDLDSIRPELVPHYTADLPKDPWGNAFEYGSSQDDQSYVLICKGSDGVDKLEKIPESPTETQCFEDEIVFEKGEFMQKPGGVQKACGGEGI